MVNNMEIKGKVALVTGASGNIGRSIALRLATSGTKVLASYLKENKVANAIAHSIRLAGSECEIFKADLTKDKNIEKMVEFAVERFGSIDILVNNAGEYASEEIERFTVTDIEYCVHVNLLSVLLLTRRVLPIMIQRKCGRIINMSSVTGIRGSIAAPYYAASKAGIIGFTKSMARKYGKYNILSNAIAPGVINTSSTRKWIAQNKLKEIISETPVGRLGTAEDVAEVVEFFARTDFVNGTVLIVGGGRV